MSTTTATAAAQANADGAAAAPTTLLQRVILPRPGDPLDVRALYMDETAAKQRSRLTSRTSTSIPPQNEVSFATYFNAFPASYWRRWTVLRAVRLRLVLDGAGRVDIYRSKADGTPIYIQGELLSEPGRHEMEVELDLAPFEDGGWYWFDVTTEDDELTLAEGGWHAPMPAPGRAAIALGSPTFNRPTDCVATLAAVGEDELVRSVVTDVIIPDQGNSKVRDQPGFDDAAAVLGDRLRVIDQPNLGGSGGYARIMYEALRHTDCEQILFMDDDILLEPDSILRALAFSRFARDPMLVGGQMLMLQARSHLHSMGEVVDHAVMRWRGAPRTEPDHDFAKESLRETAWLHRRTDVDYNAWWMCLIPRQIAEDIGLPLPLFIKWDDLEYGLRAAEAGYPTATVPGVAIWHMSFADKDDATDWQAYFHLRNRLVGAALHGPEKLPAAMLKDAFKHTLKHLLCMEYSTVELQEMAIRDFLAGPERLFEVLESALPTVRERRAQFDDGRVLPSARELPLPSMSTLAAEGLLEPPTTPFAIGKTLTRVLWHNLRPVQEKHHFRPQLNIPADDARWFLLARLDGATVSTADGRGVAFRKRDPEMFRTMLRRALASYRELAAEFPRLHRRYRQAMPALTSLDAWKRVFEDS